MNETYAKIIILMLRLIAEKKGLTQAEIAERSGLQQPHIARFFAGETMPRLDTFLAVARAIGVHFFFQDKEDKSDLSTAFNRAIEMMRGNPNAPEKMN